MPLKDSWEAIQICKCPLWKVKLVLPDWARQTGEKVGWVEVIIFDKLNYQLSATVMGSAQTMEKWLYVLFLWWCKQIKEEITKFLEPGNFKARPDPKLWKLLQDSLIHFKSTPLTCCWLADLIEGQRDVGSPLKSGTMFDTLGYPGIGHSWCRNAQFCSPE